ncbi:MAG: T9SS C-terminal target domain-containing protein, partial [Bacteroidetes bacterium]
MTMVLFGFFLTDTFVLLIHIPNSSKTEKSDIINPNQPIMKKITFLFMFMFVITNLNAQDPDITLRFTANHTCSYAQLDSIFIENLSQGGSTVLYYPDTILSLIHTGIDVINDSHNSFHVSQNYPNPFAGKTNINIVVPERDNFNISIYDITGLKLVTQEIILDQGKHHFTFFACDKQSYILVVNARNHSERQIMIQTVKGSGSMPVITYQGASFNNQTMDGSVTKDFDYAPGNELRFTGYAKGDFDIITDTPESDQDYIFEIAAEVPGQPSEISGETTVTPNETGLIYEVEE